MTIETGALIIGWNRAVPGREAAAAELFGTVTSYYEKLQKNGKITNWEPVFLQQHGGDFNGFFIVRGTNTNLDWLVKEDEFVEHNLRAAHCLTNFGVIPAYVGTNTIQEMMQRWTKTIPR
jgi:hypothetical protein